jgi:isoleucyl-tRNA synthetase
MPVAKLCYATGSSFVTMARMSDTGEHKKSEVALREEAILKFWNEHDIFKKSVDKEPTKGEYVFYDGPPFATGLPHYGHIVASVIKDVVPRYQTMRGYRVPRIWGWDCHGLPIENIVEKELGFKHKKDIKAYGIAKFNEQCRAQVLTYAHEWEKIIPRIGRWVDMEHSYRTMDKSFMESVWWVFKQLFDKGLVYEDYRSMHICPRCETTLSQQEVSEGYKDVKDISVTVKFKLKNPEKIGLSGDVYMLAWTTTPWTLPGNVALAVGNDIIYAVVPHNNEYLIIAKSRLATEPKNELGSSASKLDILGKDLVGLEYEPPFDYYINDKTLKNRENGWKVYAADFVTAESGTGIAHEAPAFGADDWELSKQVHLPFVQHVNYDGTMKPEVTDFAGMEVKPNSDDDKVRLGTDIAVLKYLQDHGTFFSKENITHSYPHCWRCDTPLLNYATSSWFVAVTQIKDNLLENAKNINWSPEHIKEGRWGKWLEGARDWSISRQRFWASVIPIWICEKCKEMRVFGSATELEAASGKKVDDLHKHIVDEITVPCDCGGTMKRIPDVLDTWFDSGSMPYGERHYPFENKEKFDAVFPAQFIAEGLDQTRAWFYYLHVLAGAIFEKNAFQNVIVNGIVLAEDGKKMAKKLKNYPDPMEVVNKYGSDALRFYLLSSPVMQAENLAFSEKGVDEIVKKNIGRLNNVLAFYELYKNDTPRDWQSTNVLDRWIVSRLDQLVEEATKGFENYQLDVAARPLTGFIDDLSVWYLRRSRDRFKATDPATTSASLQGPAVSVTVPKGTSPEAASPRLASAAAGSVADDKRDALATLRYVLHTVSRVMAPTMPFYAEYLFQAVREEEDEESVHLASWPEGNAATRFDAALVNAMAEARRVVTLALEQREKANIKVRQPLSVTRIPQISFAALPDVDALLAIIAEEINVKTIEIVAGLAAGTVELDTSITPELKEEGFVRDLVRAVQGERKNAGLNPHDTISLTVSAPDDARMIIEKNKPEIITSVKAASISFGEVANDVQNIGGHELAISVAKV